VKRSSRNFFLHNHVGVFLASFSTMCYSPHVSAFRSPANGTGSQTQIILVPSSTHCLFRRKLGYFNGKHTSFHRNMLIWCQSNYATLNTRQPYLLIDSDAEMWSVTPLKPMKIAG
jgi:hypothetical protein